MGELLENDAIFWIILGVALILAVVLALFLLGWILAGATVLLAMAASQGFLGLVAFVAAWVFLFPFMLIASVVLGIFEIRGYASLRREAKRKPGQPPKDERERLKWSNRLPPYDKE